MNGKLKLNDLLNLTDEELYNTKIRLNTYNGVTNPIEDFKKIQTVYLLGIIGITRLIVLDKSRLG